MTQEADVTLGIDPGTASFGFGLIEGNRTPNHIEHGCLTTSAKDPLGIRLASIRDELVPVFDRYQLTTVAIERLGYSRRMTSAIAVSHAIALVHLLAADRGIPVEEYSPAEIKLAVTGYGASDKVGVQHMVNRILNLPEPPQPDHATDALAVAICHIHSRSTRALEKKLDVR